MAGWWATKVRQAVRHVAGRVEPHERRDLERWLSDPQLALFDTMHRADQRHGLDVVALLRNEHADDHELLIAALLHDCAKGPMARLPHRVAWSLSERYGESVSDAAAYLPGFAPAFDRLRNHAEASARLALEAGCSKRTAALIRHQADPVDPVAGQALLLADEAA